MRWTSITSATAVAAIVAAASAGAHAQLPVGPPISVPTPFTQVPGSYEVSPLRSSDPQGGLPWGLATYRARPPRGRGEALCTEVGRVQDGALGIVSAEGIFRPYAPGASPDTSCGGIAASKGERASGYAIRVVPASLPSGCDPSAPPAQRAGCTAPVGRRTVFTASLGRGIVRARTTVDGRQRQVSVSDGLLIAVFDGSFTDATLPAIRITATICGPDARSDLVGARTVRGCQAEFEIPDDPRPAQESAASRRARRAAVVRAPLSVRETRGVASVQRFTARLIVPITTRSTAEGYTYRLRGPAGANCARARTWRAPTPYFTSYLQIAGRPYELPIMPHRGAWCRGTFELTMSFVQRHGARGASFTHKPIATTRFTVG